MRGLVAIISHDWTSSVDEAEIGALADAFESLRGQGKRYTASAGDFARVIRINTTDETHIETSGASWVASVGLVRPGKSLIGRPLESLDGQFALISFDASTDEVTVAADPFGLQAFYVAERNGKTYASTSALALAKHLRAKPNRFGIEVFVRAGYHFGSLTNWEDIERLAPGTSIVFTDKGHARRTYWQPEIDETVTRLSLQQTADHMVEVATETFRTYLDCERCYCTNLTGGYDSRMLNLLLRRAGMQFRTNTRGGDSHPDVRIAAKVAKKTGWDWLHIGLPSNWPQLQSGMIRTALAWGDSHLDVLDLSTAVWQPPQLGIEPIMFNGGGAELMRNFAWQQEFFRIGKSREVNLDNLIDMRMLHPMDTSVLARDSTADVRDDFRGRLSGWTKRFAAELNTTQLDMMYAYKCTGHFGLYGPAFGAYGLIQSPLFFKPIFNIAVSSNWRYRNGHGLMRQVMQRLDPKVAAITTTSGGPAQPMRATNLHRFLPYYTDVGLRAANKLAEKTFGRGFLPNSLPPGSENMETRRASLDCLRNGHKGQPIYDQLRSASLYNRSRLNDLLARAQQPDFRDVRLLGRIITVEMALRAVDTHMDECVGGRQLCAAPVLQ